MLKKLSKQKFWTIIAMIFVAGCSTDQNGKQVTTDAQLDSLHYKEQHRPQFHFTPEKMWMNDPNGLVFYEGEYHLFYQYYPDSTVWGPMHWGHAVSPDLLHWEHLPVALFPDSLGYIFSGSAVIDWKNTSGLGLGGKPPMIAFFTHHDMERRRTGRTDYETQSIAYSHDNGRTWSKYQHNPVVGNPGSKDFRDPKVFWFDPGNKWVMVVTSHDHLKFYSSTDLKSWEVTGEFGKEEGNHSGVWECPDLFPLQAGDLEKWVLIQNINPGHPNGGSGAQYFIGEFDGSTFINDNPPDMELWLDYGKDNYAGVTWSDIPSEDGRRLFIGWMSNWQYAQVVPTDNWRSAMTLPRTLHLKETPLGLRVASLPVTTVTKIREEAVAFGRGDHQEPVELLRNVKNRNGLYEVQLEIIKPTSGRVEIEVYNSEGDLLYVGYDVDQNEYYIDRLTAGQSDFSDDFAGRHIAPRFSDSENIKMHLFFDVASVELFADDGLTVMTEIFFPKNPYSDIMLKSDQYPLKVMRGRVFGLKSIW